ncbi:hypothetical protein V6N12_076112 [Hibiscus sabdariffa]|uniref:Uncharacterized protein n=1 Tax=Hibiscus sabdariffa TaxID=183260 RepID=A0ABR2AYE2_9ROSI
MDSGLRAFVPAQFSSSVTVRNHHYLLALRRNWHRAARGKRMPLIRMSKVISQDVGHRVKPTTFITFLGHWIGDGMSWLDQEKVRASRGGLGDATKGRMVSI